LRRVLDAIFYVLRSGCAWRLLPHEFAPWRSVYYWFRKWRIDGTFERLNAALGERLRELSGRNAQPPASAGIVDSQSAKTTGVGGENREDTMVGRRWKGGSVICWWTPRRFGSQSQDPQRKGPRPRWANASLLKAASERFPRLSHLWVDAGYQGRGEEWAEQQLGLLGLSVEVIHRTPKPIPEKIARIWAEEWAKEGREIDWHKLLPRRGFEVLPRRWVVERTFSWLSQNRRMSKDYERLCATGETFIYAAMSRLMVRRLARA
jgi:putative transposase